MRSTWSPGATSETAAGSVTVTCIATMPGGSPRSSAVPLSDAVNLRRSAKGIIKLLAFAAKAAGATDADAAAAVRAVYWQDLANIQIH